jgi:hypothetical protein
MALINVTCCAAAIPPLLGGKRTLPGHRNSVARDPTATLPTPNGPQAPKQGAGETIDGLVSMKLILVDVTARPFRLGST